NKLKPQILQAASTTNAGKHMKLIHQIDEDGLIELEKITPSELSLEHYYRRLSPSNAEQWRQNFVNWIVHDDITFKQ
ncbi:hypothetical protein B0A49_13891, partial [Cryomyces minteri]